MITLPGRAGKYRAEHFPKRLAADCTAADEEKVKGETFIMSQNLAEKTDLGRKVGLGAVVAVATGPPVYYMWEKQNRKAA